MMFCGGIYLNNITATNNYANNSGAFLLVRLVKELIMKNSIFKNNSCLSVGAALTLINEKTIIHNCTFIENTS